MPPGFARGGEPRARQKHHVLARLRASFNFLSHLRYHCVITPALQRHFFSRDTSNEGASALLLLFAYAQPYILSRPAGYSAYTL